MNPHVKFNNANALFSKTLKQKTNLYFQNLNKNKTGDFRLFLKTGILLTTLATLYSLLFFADLHVAINVILSILLGVNLAAIGFNVMHDAGHNSFSENKTINTIFSYSLNLLGGNIYFWKMKHNIAHHTYTNIDGEDHDIEIKFMRIHHDQQLKKHHKYQKLYFIFLYSISYMAWIFYQDYEKYFRQRMGVKSTEKFNFPVREKVIFWVSKVVHTTIFLLIPILMVGVAKTLICLLISYVVCGLCLAIVFQLAHVVEQTDFKTVEENKIEEEWMIHQLQSTANFSTKNPILTWLLGGLNFQVEHHLFPKVSHIHYPALNKIVQETCRANDISYFEYPSIFKAFRSHFNVIKLMSK